MVSDGDTSKLGQGTKERDVLRCYQSCKCCNTLRLVFYDTEDQAFLKYPINNHHHPSACMEVEILHQKTIQFLFTYFPACRSLFAVTDQ